MPAPIGTPLYAVADGVVTHALAAWEDGFSGYGAHVVIRADHAAQHEPGAPVWLLYGHMHDVAVTPGQEVRAGQRIGSVGNTKFTREDKTALLDSGPHVHFEVSPTRYPQRAEAPRLDPSVWLKAARMHPFIGHTGYVGNKPTGIRSPQEAPPAAGRPFSVALPSCSACSAPLVLPSPTAPVLAEVRRAAALTDVELQRAAMALRQLAAASTSRGPAFAALPLALELVDRLKAGS